MKKKVRVFLFFIGLFLSVSVFADRFPTAFSPNGDGKNDIFAKGYKIKVLNRNGFLIFSGDDGWRGETKYNQKADAGIYFYEIELENGEKVRGTVELFKERK